MAELDCEILTPEGRVFEGRAQMVVVPGTEGELGVLPRHAPIIAPPQGGRGAREVRGRRVALAGRSSEGYFKMQSDRRARAGRGRGRRRASTSTSRRPGPMEDAQARIAEAAGGDSEVDRCRAERDLLYAENRIRIAGR